MFHINFLKCDKKSTFIQVFKLLRFAKIRVEFSECLSLFLCVCGVEVGGGVISSGLSTHIWTQLSTHVFKIVVLAKCCSASS